MYRWLELNLLVSKMIDAVICASGSAVGIGSAVGLGSALRPLSEAHLARGPNCASVCASFDVSDKTTHHNTVIDDSKKNTCLSISKANLIQSECH